MVKHLSLVKGKYFFEVIYIIFNIFSNFTFISTFTTGQDSSFSQYFKKINSQIYGYSKDISAKIIDRVQV